MCGIVGFLDKSGGSKGTVGKTILDMLSALGGRGPDSAGVALYGERDDECQVVQVKLGDSGQFEQKGQQVEERMKQLGLLRYSTITAEYLRLVVDDRDDRLALEEEIEAIDDQFEVVSMGKRLEIIKQVGSPEKLNSTYGVSEFEGNCGIGHTRFATESRVDLSHSQPFWAHGFPELAIVHNGHITNYHKMRRRYEQRGVRFYTENDSEVIGVYMADHLSQGETLEEALTASVTDFDGSFSYLATTHDAIGFAKDPFALKPLVVADTSDFAAIATEEIAIRAALGDNFEVREAQAREVRVWQR